MALNTEILSRAATEARGLAMDAVQAAASGHLGLPLGAAEVGAVLFNPSYAPRTDTREGGESGRDEGSEILDLIRLRDQNEDGNLPAGKVLPMLPVRRRFQ